jgi:hypothetical protein
MAAQRLERSFIMSKPADVKARTGDHHLGKLQNGMVGVCKSPVSGNLVHAGTLEIPLGDGAKVLDLPPIRPVALQAPPSHSLRQLIPLL